MTSTPYTSLWTTAAGPEYGPLTGDHETEVAIIGAGIAGMSAAQLLHRAGHRVTVIEARRVGRQVTGLSSAKVTSQHNLIYAKLATDFGVDAARIYADVNEAGLRHIAETVASLGSDCQFETRAAYTYTSNPARLDELRDEVAVAASLGLPARFADSAPLPYPVAGAVVFDGQAQFDPYAYLRDLTSALVADGVTVFERTRVTNVEEGAPCRIETEHGTVTAQHVILATNLPILDDGKQFMRAYPIAHAVVTLDLVGEDPDGMFISIDEPTRSVRTARGASGRQLLVVGPRFDPGKDVDTAHEFGVLEAWARAHFEVGETRYRWTNIDYQSIDGLPYIGRMSDDTPHILVATGFSGWGITTGVAAAHVLTNLVAGHETEASRLFDATRINARQSAGSFLSSGFDQAKTWVQDRLTRLDEFEPGVVMTGEGRVFEVDGRKVAVSRDEAGNLHAVAAECSHLGCVLGWNTGMATWDCPCHGSIFTADGEVLHGPAVNHLERVELPQTDDEEAGTDEHVARIAD